MEPSEVEELRSHPAQAQPVSELERLVQECLDRMEGEGEAAIDAVCAAHPVEASAVREEIEFLRRIGLLGGSPASDVRELPARLGEFRLLQRLGGGGMGVVYAALQESMGRRVALKIVRPAHLYFAGSRSRFRREVETVARLHHPGIVPVFCVGEQDGLPYFAMQLVEGCTLAEVIESLGDRDPERLTAADLPRAIEAVSRKNQPWLPTRSPPGDLAWGEGSWVKACFRLASQVALALEHVHRHGVVHRDVKPSNIMVTSEGCCLLVDFGLSVAEGTSRLTQTNALPGSLPYMAPERLRGERVVDPRSDVYSLGATLYELLTLRMAFAADSSEETRRRVLSGDCAPPRRLNRQLPRDAETVCLAALEPDPARRYASAERFQSDLENVLTLRPIAARRAGTPLVVQRFAQRHPVAVTATLLATLTFAGSGGVLLRQRSADRERVRDLVADARKLASEGELDVALERTGQALGILPGHAHALALREELLQRSRAVSRAAEERAEQALDEVLRLSDLQRLHGLIREADEMWPAASMHAAETESYAAQIFPWLERAEALRTKLPQHLASLYELRRRSRNVSIWKAEQADSGAEVAAGADRAQAFLEQAIEWSFDNPEDTWRHALLAQLVSELEGSARLIEELRARGRLASSLAECSVTGALARARWAGARADVAQRPIYGGLDLEPQLGLLPLSRDPQSGLWEFLHLPTDGHRASDDALPRGPRDASSGVVLVLVPGGTFHMGSWPEDDEHRLGSPCVDPGHRKHEAPVHEVRIEPFFLAKYELTQEQWTRVTGSNPSASQGASPLVPGPFGTRPLENVSWEDCALWLERIGLALPTEAQWEYACRAGSTTVYSSGDELASLGGRANLADSSCKDLGSPPGLRFEADLFDGHPSHAPVGLFLPNAWGFHDMHGNVWEWCRDSLLEDWQAYGVVAERAGDGLREGPPGPSRASRGGSFLSLAISARSAARSDNRPDAAQEDQGVRPARALVR